jgi:chemotaxis protein histidine kinase CheA
VSERLDRYFALEAAEYLDQLDELLARPGPPDLDQLLRFCRGVRGSAGMAGAESVAAVAERLEEGLRSVQGNHVAWSDAIQRLSQQTVSDLKLLVRASGRWGQMDEARVHAAIRRWEEVESAPQDEAPREMHFTWQDALGEPASPRRGRSQAPEVPIESLFYDDAGPHVLATDSEGEMDQQTAATAAHTVPIEALLLDRDGALHEALAMRDTLERMMRQVPGAEVELAGVVRELFELLEIAAAGVASSG